MFLYKGGQFEYFKISLYFCDHKHCFSIWKGTNNPMFRRRHCTLSRIYISDFGRIIGYERLPESWSAIRPDTNRKPLLYLYSFIRKVCKYIILGVSGFNWPNFGNRHILSSRINNIFFALSKSNFTEFLANYQVWFKCIMDAPT